MEEMMIGSVPFPVMLRDLTFTVFIFSIYYILSSWRVSKHLVRLLLLVCYGVMILLLITLALHFPRQIYELSRSILQAAILFAGCAYMKERGVRAIVPIITSVTLVAVLSMPYLALRSFFYTELSCLVVVIPFEAVALLLAVKVVRGHLKEMMTYLQKGWWVIAFCLGCPVLTFAFVSIQPTNGYVHSAYITAMCGLSVVALVNHAVVYVLYRVIRGQYKSQEENQVMFMQLTTMKSQVEHMAALDQEVRILSHDLRHVVSVVNLALEEKRYDTAKETLHSLIAQIDNTKHFRTVHYCNLPMLNAAVSYYAALAQEQDIQVEISLRIDRTLPCTELELAVVLANAMENAIHAMEHLESERRLLTVLVRFVKTQLFVEVENYFAGILLLDEESGLPTTRQDGHGMGMISILSFVKKYDGLLSCTQEAGVFHIRLVL